MEALSSILAPTTILPVEATQVSFGMFDQHRVAIRVHDAYVHTYIHCLT
jgi:hypothetical protein